MSEHTKEPWHTGGKFEAIIYDIDGNAVASAVTHHAAHPAEAASWNAGRIVACVNACAGIDTEWLENNGAYAVPVPSLRTLLNQRDGLLAALKSLVAHADDVGEDCTEVYLAKVAIAACEVQS